MYLVNSENKHFFFHFLQFGLLIFLFVHSFNFIDMELVAYVLGLEMYVVLLTLI